MIESTAGVTQRLATAVERPTPLAQGAPDSVVEALLKLMHERRVVIVGPDEKPLGPRQLLPLFAGVLPEAAMRAGSLSDGLSTAVYTDWANRINTYADQRPGVPLSVASFIHGALPNPLESLFSVFADPPVLGARLDVDVIDVYKQVMEKNEVQRNDIRDLLSSLQAEAKIFSIIQSEINVAMAAKESFSTTSSNLADRSLYGYTSDEQWQNSAEFKLLSSLDTYSGDMSKSFTISDFLRGVTKPGTSGPQKESGSMKDVKNSYAFDKDNNPVAAFAGAVGDRARMVNDKVSQQTIRLKDFTSRYDTAIEGMNRFIDKYYNLMSDILRAL